MKRNMLAALPVFLFAYALALAGPEPPAGKSPSGYGVEIKIAPKEGVAGQFICEATVTDLGTGMVISTPRVEFLQGKSGTMLGDDANGKREVLLSAGVEGNATRASYTVEIREGETLVSSQKGSVKLR
jgi:hypothetical protein